MHAIPTDHGVIDKRPLREKLLADMDEFLRRNGKVTEVAPGVCAGDYGPLSPEKQAERARKRGRILKSNGDLFGFREAK